METIAIFSFFVLAVFVGAIIVVGWATVSIMRAVVRAVWPRHALVPITSPRPQVCANEQCRGTNPSHARFCRRCGKSLPSLMRTISSRVAML
ncbi:MAG TPA: hypothetical protein VF624_18275 [Tepidisphaeraceae bacterium]|jgi:hypothetical protein